MTHRRSRDKVNVAPLAVVASSEHLEAARDQAIAIMDAHGANAHRIVLAPNALPGKGFRPLTGYTIKLSLDADFVPAHYDLQNLFRGRCVLALTRGADNLIEPAGGDQFANAQLLSAFEDAQEAALASVNTDVGSFSLRASDGWPPMCCLYYDTRADIYFIVCDAHMLPAEEAVPDGLPLATFLQREVEARKVSVSEAFFGSGNVGRLMKAYFLAQKTYRERLCLEVRKRMLQTIVVGPGNWEDFVLSTSEPAHTITNTADMNLHGTRFLFYANTADATMKGGAFVGAGPFRSGLWVNFDKDASHVSQAIVAAKTLHMVPYHMPIATGPAMALIRIAGHRSRDDDDDDDDDLADADFADADVDYDRGYTHLSSVVKEPLGKQDRMRGPMGIPIDTSEVVGDLVWRHYRRPDDIFLETYSPHEYLPFLQGIETGGVRRAFEILGVDLDGRDASFHRPMPPTYCAAGPAPPSASLILMMATHDSMA